MKNEEYMTEDEVLDILTEEMGFCGCGLPIEAGELLYDVLKILSLRKPGLSKEEWMKTYNDLDELLGSKINYKLYWSYLYYLGDKELIEHRGNIGGSWLTDKGEDLLKRISIFYENYVED